MDDNPNLDNIEFDDEDNMEMRENEAFERQNELNNVVIRNEAEHMNNFINPNVAEEDEDDDFPEYANEQNKQLNEIIKEKRKVHKEFKTKYEEKADRVKILKEHYKNVNAELLHTQALIDKKNEEIEAEHHLKKVADRQIGRLDSELRKYEKSGVEEQERLNDIQNQIFRGNEKLDKFKLEMNWNQEELEQWALAAKQKEEDNITLERYKRADEGKIKELNLQIERLTIEVGRKQNELEKEITVTQAAQIELDKTAEEFKRHHEERHKHFLQWQEVSENIARRDKAIVEEGENFAKIKIKINNNKAILEDAKDILKQKKLENKNIEMTIGINERKIVDERAVNKRIEESIENLKAEVEILKNQLSAFSTDLANKKNKVAHLGQDLLAKKQRLDNAQKKYTQQEIKLKNEDLLALEFENAKQLAEAKFKENELKKQDLEKKIRIQKDVHFKCTQDLFKIREQEANLYGEIQGTMAACRNLQSHITKLNQVVKHKADTLVRHDIMKLEIKKIQDRVNSATDKVFNLENRKYQLEMSMQEKEREIHVHRDVLIAEHKAAEEERHKIAVELAERKNRVKNLKIKYESLVQKNKASNGEVETVNEHSQAYYIIKAAQEKEELQRKGDELNAKIIKSEKELKALVNTLNHLKNRNSTYRDSFLNKDVTSDDKQHSEALNEQCKNASKNLFEKQKELKKVQKEFEEDAKRLSEVTNKFELLKSQYRDISINFDKVQSELKEQAEKMERAQKSVSAFRNNIKNLKINFEKTPGFLQLRYDVESNKNKTVLSALYQIANEFPEISVALQDKLKDKNLNLPSRAPSSIDIKSNKSISSF